jgi:threonine/homoserine/homoserine lactone efflux protein
MLLSAYLLQGFLLGLASGLAPGPLLTLVIKETLQHGFAAGVRVAFAPLITDGLMIAVFWTLYETAFRIDRALGWIGIAGGVFLLVLAYECIRAKRPEAGEPDAKARSLAYSVTVNLLNPAPYLFWSAVGAPILVRANQTAGYLPIVFVASFFVTIIGAKVAVALLLARSARRFSTRAYRAVMIATGTALIGLAAWFFADGVHRIVGGAALG